MTKESFQSAMCEAIMSLPRDMKTMLRVVEDPYLSDELRTLAAGGLIHVLSAHNAIPGMRGTLAYVDDVIILRLVVERIEKEAPERIEKHREDFPEVYGPMGEQMEAARAYLGERMSVLDKACDGVAELNHMGHDAKECARDEEAATWLYDAVHEALINELEFDEDEVARALRDVEDIKRPLDQRLATTS